MPDYLFNDFINAELLLPQFLYKDITVHFAGNFSRAYSGDIRSIVLNNAVAQLTLNRNGLYHQLPEGLFHVADSLLDMGGMEAVASMSRYLKQEAAKVRCFFQPMEQVMFEERCMISHNSMQPVLKDLLQSICGCREEKFLQQLIPFLSDIRSCKSVPVAISLISRIIELPVSYSWKSDSKYWDIIPLEGGGTELGVNLVLGDTIGEEVSILLINVGPVTTTDAPAYLPWNSEGRFLRLLENLLLPAAVEISWQLIIEKADHICMLGGPMYC